MKKSKIFAFATLWLLLFMTINACVVNVWAISNESLDTNTISLSSLIIAEDGVLLGNKTNLLDENATYVKNVSAFSVINVDYKSNEGYLLLKYKNESTEYTIIVTTFYQKESWQDGGIATNILLHGTTGHGDTSFPTVFAHLAGWGNATVYLNNTKAYENVAIEFFYSYGFRNDTDLKIYNSTGTGLFNVSDPNNVEIDPSDVELHIILNSSEFLAYVFFERIVKYPKAIFVNSYLIGDQNDLLNYNGSKVTPIFSYTILEVNPDTDKGFVLTYAEIDASKYLILFDNFTNEYDGGIAKMIDVFGDTGKGTSGYPKVKAYLAGKGYSTIFINGSLTYSEVLSEFYMTVGIIDEVTHSVYNSTKTGTYNPSSPTNVYIDIDDVELHLFLNSVQVKQHYLFEDAYHISLDVQLQIVAFQLSDAIDAIDELIAEAEALNQTDIVERLRNLREELVEMRDRITAANATMGTYLDQLEDELNETKALLNESQSLLNETREELDRTKRELENLKFDYIQAKNNATFYHDLVEYWKQSAQDNLWLGLVIGIVVGVAVGVATPIFSKKLSVLFKKRKEEE